MSTTADYTEQELACLYRLPVAVFHAVAMADGRIQYPELHHFAAMLRVLSASTRPEDEVLTRMFSVVAADLPAALDGFGRLLKHGVSVEDAIWEGCRVLEERATPEQATLVKQTLADLAVAIARAYPPFARRPSPAEVEVIERVRRLLWAPSEG